MLRNFVFLIPLLSSFSAMAQENPCEIPFTRMTDRLGTGRAFTPAQAMNPDPTVEPMFRNRYIVMDLNTVGDDGLCKGVQERYPAPGDHALFEAEFRQYPALRENYQRSIEAGYNPPIVRNRVHRYGYSGENLCMGQTISLCEVRGNRGFEVARFITSSSHTRHWGEMPSTDFYYTPMMHVNTRRWEGRRPYTEGDMYRDNLLGGITPTERTGSRALDFRGAPMPNFVNFIPTYPYRGQDGNGIHRRVGTEGPGTEGDLGAPSSLGCLRVTHYGSRFIRWWIPREARVFPFFESGRYRRHANNDGSPVRR